jgi:branched-chain amino acid transport system ATP-binding protein
VEVVADMSTALELDAVSQHFGSLKAVDEVSFSVAPGSRHAVIGPNGAGKSTLFALIAGTRPPTGGRVLLRGNDITSMSEPRRVTAGVVRTFQHSSLFLSCTALENVLLAAQRRAGLSWSLLRPVRRRKDLLDAAHDLLQLVGLADRHNAVAGGLSHGERRQLEVAVALACRPSVLLLDEPAAGMSPRETARLGESIRALPEEVTVLLVEHDLDLVFGLADTVTVLHLGEHLMTGTPAEVRASPEVQKAYLGAGDSSDLFLEDSR